MAEISLRHCDSSSLRISWMAKPSSWHGEKKTERCQNNSDTWVKYYMHVVCLNLLKQCSHLTMAKPLYVICACAFTRNQIPLAPDIWGRSRRLNDSSCTPAITCQHFHYRPIWVSTYSTLQQLCPNSILHTDNILYTTQSALFPELVYKTTHETAFHKQEITQHGHKNRSTEVQLWNATANWIHANQAESPAKS